MLSRSPSATSWPTAVYTAWRTWALGGLILSLGSSIVAARLGIANHAAGGALLAGSIAAYATGLVLAGTGFSTAYAGVLHSLAHVPAHGRGRLFAALYVVCCLAFSVPAIIGGVAADSYGLGRTATGYTLFVLLMVALAVAARFRSHAAAGPPPETPGPDTAPESERAKTTSKP